MQYNIYFHIVFFQMKDLYVVVLCLICLIVSLTSVPIKQCTKQEQYLIPNFTYSSNGSIDQTTKANICHNDTHLVVKWVNVDSQVMSPYNNCNDPLYTDDAVQIFIANSLKQGQPAIYYQLQINPKSALFFAQITNPLWKCYNLQTKYINCDKAFYRSKVVTGGWEAELAISFQFLNNGQPISEYYVNLFRIDKSQSKPTRYLSWNPNYANPPCFHMPSAFKKIEIIKSQEPQKFFVQ